VTALFHDSGYIRHLERDRDFTNGAEFTMYHVSRSADFLRRYLPGIGMEADLGTASRIVHFTGYELDLDHIEFEDPRDAICGHLLGTADLIAQMADRCYLEKCRDRLYKEFVLGGVAVENARPGEYRVRYASGIDLLSKTPLFYQQVSRERLCNKFNRAYRYIEVLYDGQNPYVEAIRNNMAHLLRILKSGDWSLLRRRPPYFVGDDGAVETMDHLARRLLAALPRDRIRPVPGFVPARRAARRSAQHRARRERERRAARPGHSRQRQHREQAHDRDHEPAVAAFQERRCAQQPSQGSRRRDGGDHRGRREHGDADHHHAHDARLDGGRARQAESAKRRLRRVDEQEVTGPGERAGHEVGQCRRRGAAIVACLDRV